MRQYGDKSLPLRVVLGGLIAGAIAGLPAAAIALNAYLATAASWPIVALSALAVAGLTALATWLWPKRLWRTPVARRLWTYESPDRLPWAIRVLARPVDADRASAALRRARFNPYSYMMLTSPPPDALDLSMQINVIRPDAWHPTVSDEAQVLDVADVFRKEEIRARVAGVDVVPAAEKHPELPKLMLAEQCPPGG